MKMKKFLSLACASAMTLSMAAPALAADSPIEDISSATNFTYTGEVNKGTIKITMPTTGKVFINPYKIEMQLSDDAEPVTDQVISATQYIQNESNTGLKIGVTVTGTPNDDGTLDLKPTALADSDAQKLAFINFQIQQAAEAAEPESWTSAKSVAVKTAAQTPALEDTGIVLDKVEGENCFAAFRVQGTVVEEPVTTATPPEADPWTDNDTVEITVAFTFTPYNETTE